MRVGADPGNFVVGETEFPRFCFIKQKYLIICVFQESFKKKSLRCITIYNFWNFLGSLEVYLGFIIFLFSLNNLIFFAEFRICGINKNIV